MVMGDWVIDGRLVWLHYRSMQMITHLFLMMVSRLLRSGGAVVGVLFVLYFALFAFEGDRGLASLQSLESQVAEAQADLDRVLGEREAIERKVVALRPGSIDPDLLEEVSRSELGYVRPDEVVILGR